MAQQDQEHPTTEQLSAYIDRQLSPEEQAFCDAHLSTCQRCQESLAGLRSTVALLQALPRMTPARTFRLTPEMLGQERRTPLAAEEQARASEAEPRAVVRHLPERGRRRSSTPRSTLRSTLRVLSTLAAVLALVLLASSFLSLPSGGSANMTSRPASLGATHGTAGTASSASGTQPNLNDKAGATDKTPVPATQRSEPGQRSPSVTAVPPSSEPQFGAEETSPPFFSLTDLGAPGTRLILGLILLAAGLAGIVATRQRSGHIPS